jgi:hypothetical protein
MWFPPLQDVNSCANGSVSELSRHVAFEVITLVKGCLNLTAGYRYFLSTSETYRSFRLRWVSFWLVRCYEFEWEISGVK